VIALISTSSKFGSLIFGISVGALRSWTLSSRSSADIDFGSMMRRSWFFIAQAIRFVRMSAKA